jgi:hypothetical protein
MADRYNINLDNIDHELLKKQKQDLLVVMDIIETYIGKKHPQFTQSELDSLEGILNMIDTIDGTIEAGDFVKSY